MVYTTITTSEIDEGSPVTITLMTKIKDNMDDINLRIEQAEITTVTLDNNVAARTSPLLQLGDTTSGNVTSTLPDAADMANGILDFKSIVASNDFIIDGYSTQTLDGATTQTIDTQYDSIKVISDGSNWHLIGGTYIATADLDNTRLINTTSPLAGGGDLTANRTLSVSNLTNSEVDASAAIAYSKTALTGGILNADINASAAIAHSKLNLTGSITNSDVNASAGIVGGVGGKIDYASLNPATGGIVNADVNASAAIQWSKMLSLSSSVACVTHSSTGQLYYNSSISATEYGYMSGVTSDIQAQLDAKVDIGDNTVNGSDTEATTESYQTFATLTGYVDGSNVWKGCYMLVDIVAAGSNTKGSYLLNVCFSSTLADNVHVSKTHTEGTDVADFQGVVSGNDLLVQYRETTGSTTDFTTRYSLIGY